jgi:hypothetical protein
MFFHPARAKVQLHSKPRNRHHGIGELIDHDKAQQAHFIGQDAL